MAISLRTVRIPDFGIPLERPTIPSAIYEQRVAALKARVGTDWIAVYADREHNANIAFLTGFEPRFEEALFLLGPGDLRILIVGNECLSYAPLAGLPGIETMLCQTMSLMGQDRGRRPNLLAVLRDAGISRGASIGLVGWKYLELEEWSGPLPSFQASALVVDSLRLAAGDPAAVVDATPAMMHPEQGLRAVVDAHQIAAGEWGAARASAAVWRIVSGLRDGDSEYAAVARMGYAGEALNAHVMFASARAGEPVVGLRSPTARIVRAGDGVTTAVSYWGGLSSRAGLANDGDDAFLDVSKAYFRGLIAWYETADIGVTGGALFDSVTGALAEGGLESALNPGHLVGHDEWVHSPVRPGSTETIRSGMPFQIDVIPVPMPDGWALNCEDAVTFADEDLRSELAELYPDVWERIVARRAFMSDEIGVTPATSILPLSSTPLCLPPFWLAADRLLARD
ncbi:MAG TPA: Xaa-Pro aminopeptidase [Kaistia sp.]|nr:Xaa-Pro aminopeptidase [Kaistia sp.]